METLKNIAFYTDMLIGLCVSICIASYAAFSVFKETQGWAKIVDWRSKSKKSLRNSEVQCDPAAANEPK